MEADLSSTSRLQRQFQHNKDRTNRATTMLTLDALSDHQRAQLAKIARAPVAILDGAPGTGKTTCAAAIIKEIVRRSGAGQIAVCAPTGKAAVRISEKMQDAKLPLKASTIHALLKVRPVEGGLDGWGFEHGRRNPLSYRYVIVDEASMIDVGLAASLLSALSTGTHLLLVCDTNQLPPIGHGAFVRDLIAAGIPRATLSEIQRNAGRIVTACHEIKDGKTPRISESLSAWPLQNLVQLPWPKGEPKDRGRQMLERIDSIYDWLTQLPQVKEWRWSLIDDVQVIVARNATRQTLNAHLQARLNAAGERGPHGSYRTGDKVICLRNGFCVSADDRNGKQVYCANGDVGRVQSFRGKHAIVALASPPRLVLVPLTKQAEEQQQAHAKDTNGEDGRPARAWDLAYAVTCHKAQGSEYPVVIVLVEGAGKLGSREWLYTAVSRARELCVLIGDTSDMRRYVRNVCLPDRKTFLVEQLTGRLPL